MSIKIFISHSSEDEELVQLILRILEDSLEIADGSIRCTSVPGYKLLAGAHTSTTLKDDLTESELIIGVITRNSLKSGYVLFELGASWGMGKWTIALLGKDVDFNDIPGPLKENNAIRITDRADLFQLIDDIASRLQFKKRPTSKSATAIDALISFVTTMNVNILDTVNGTNTQTTSNKAPNEDTGEEVTLIIDPLKSWFYRRYRDHDVEKPDDLVLNFYCRLVNRYDRRIGFTKYY